MDEELKQLIEKNLKLTEEVRDMTKSIKNYVLFQKIMSLVYFLIIFVPIILGVIYLPPILKNLFNQYQGILGGAPIQDITDLLKDQSAGSRQGINSGNLNQ